MQKTNVCTNPFSLSMTTDNTQDNNKNIHYLSNPFMPESKVGGSNTNPSTDYVHPLQMNGPIFKDFSSYPSLFSNAIPSDINYSKVPGNPFSNETTKTTVIVNINFTIFILLLSLNHPSTIPTIETTSIYIAK